MYIYEWTIYFEHYHQVSTQMVKLHIILRCKIQSTGKTQHSYNLLPLLPPFLLVESEGTGVTSSILPILKPDLAKALKADWPPGPGVLVLVPPVALILTWTAVIPTSLHFSATSWAANIAAYGEDSSLSALTFIPPVTLAMVSLPERSVTWTKVSLKEAKIRATPKTWERSIC